jgi:nucleoside recognition membrane protein YjiH
VILKETKEKPYELKNSYVKSFIKFAVASILGVFIFFVPTIDGKLPFELIYNDLFLNGIIGNTRLYWITIIPPVMVLGYIYGKKFAKKESWIYKFFNEDTKFHLAMYIVSTVFAIMYYFKIGSEMVYGPHTGGVIIGSVLNFTISMLPVGSMLLPLLASYGLLEVVGCLLSPMMRPVFKIPGKSALDTVASIVGSAVVGILFTSQLYKNKEYTQREAFFISTNFSLSSVGYCAFILGYAGLIKNFGLMFLCYVIITYFMAAIIVRIPPTSRYKDEYIDGTIQTEEQRMEYSVFDKDRFKRAIHKAVKKADGADPVLKELGRGFVNGLGIAAKVVPSIMSIGVIGLMINEYTPILKYISLPFVPIVTLLGIPGADIAARAIVAGGIDMFMPVVLVAGVANEATRFFVAMISLVQVLYITETMLPIIFFGIPAKFKDIVIIWLQRTLVAMPLVALLTHIFY